MPDPAAYIFQGGSLLSPGSPLEEPVPAALARGAFGDPAFFEAPRLDGQGPILAADIPPDIPVPPGWEVLSVRQVLSKICSGMVDGAGLAGRLLRAFHIAQWRRDSFFCGSCGARNGDSPSELARLCPVCGRLEFPRISPAVIVIIVNDKGEALLAHNKKFAAGVYSLIAGFNEAGESLEETAVREIREEAGIEVKDLRYIASQPWPFPNSLMLGFCARHAGGEIRPDGLEIEDARWFRPDNLPGLPGGGSVSRALINRWLEGTLP